MLNNGAVFFILFGFFAFFFVHPIEVKLIACEHDVFSIRRDIRPIQTFFFFFPVFNFIKFSGF